jgi:hypothetical protein
MREERAEISKMSRAMVNNAPERSSGLTDRTDIAIPPENAIANVPSSATHQSLTKQQKGERRYVGEDNKQAEQPRDLNGTGPTSRKRSYVARQWHRRERIGFQQAEAMQRPIGCAEHDDDEMSRMEVDLSGLAVILQKGIEDKEDVLVGNSPIRIEKSKQKERGNQSG